MADRHQNFYNMQEKCAYYRGVFIHYCIATENYIDLILSFYFGGNNAIKRTELMYLFLASERSSLAYKFEVLLFIIEGHYKEFNKEYNLTPLEEHNKDKTKRKHQKPPTLNSKMTEIIQARNKLAHRMFISEENKVLAFDNDTIYLNTLIGKGGELKETEFIMSEKVLNTWVKKFSEVATAFAALLKLVKEEK